MTEFGYILIIIFEVILTCLMIWGLVWLERRVNSYIEKTDAISNDFVQKIKTLRKTLFDINEKIKTLKKIDFKEAREISVLILDIFNFIMLIKSFDFKKGGGLHLRDIKKLIPFSLLKKISDLMKTAF